MSRPMVVLAELDVLTGRLRDGADDYARRVEWLADNWRTARLTRSGPRVPAAVRALPPRGTAGETRSEGSGTNPGAASGGFRSP